MAEIQVKRSVRLATEAVQRKQKAPVVHGKCSRSLCGSGQTRVYQTRIPFDQNSASRMSWKSIGP